MFWVFWLRTVLLSIRSFSIPDPGSKRFLDPGSASASKNFSILTQKLFLSSRKYYPGCSSRIRDHGFLPVPDPKSRGQKGTGLRIPYPGSGSVTLIMDVCFSRRCCSSTALLRSVWSAVYSVEPPAVAGRYTSLCQVTAFVSTPDSPDPV